MAALFTPVDMTDYETTFTGWPELPGPLPVTQWNKLAYYSDEPMPQTDAYPEWEERENPERFGTSPTMQALMNDTYADPPDPDETYWYGKEVESEDDYDEEGDEEGDDEGDDEGEEDDGDYGEEEVDTEDPWPNPAENRQMPAYWEDRFFRSGETLRGKYSEMELRNFMKLLGVRPRVQWEDTSTHHHKTGLHLYEDEA